MVLKFGRKRYCTLTPEEHRRVRDSVEEANRVGWISWEEARKRY